MGISDLARKWCVDADAVGGKGRAWQSKRLDRWKRSMRWMIVRQGKVSWSKRGMRVSFCAAEDLAGASRVGSRGDGTFGR